MKKPVKSTGSDYACPACDNSYSRISDSRVSGTYRRRRRVCSNRKCGYKFTTYEIEDTAMGDVLEKARLFDEIRAMTGKVA